MTVLCSVQCQSINSHVDKKNAWDFQCHVISSITEVKLPTVPQSQQETLKHAFEWSFSI